MRIYWTISITWKVLTYRSTDYSCLVNGETTFSYNHHDSDVLQLSFRNSLRSTPLFVGESGYTSLLYPGVTLLHTTGLVCWPVGWVQLFSWASTVRRTTLAPKCKSFIGQAGARQVTRLVWVTQRIPGKAVRRKSLWMDTPHFVSLLIHPPVVWVMWERAMLSLAHKDLQVKMWMACKVSRVQMQWVWAACKVLQVQEVWVSASKAIKI